MGGPPGMKGFLFSLPERKGTSLWMGCWYNAGGKTLVLRNEDLPACLSALLA